MLCKFYLLPGKSHFDIDDADCVEITDCITNLNEIKMSYVRQELDSVVRKCASEIIVTGSARALLIDEYETNYLKSEASIGIFAIQNNWEYNKVWQCPLDFSTFKYDANTAGVNCLDNSAAALIKAKGSIKYEYPVSELKDGCGLNFDGVKLRKERSMRAIGLTVEDKQYMTATLPSKDWWFPRLGDVSASDESKMFLIADQEESSADGVENGWGFPVNNYTGCYFLECLKNGIVHVDFSSFEIGTGLNFGLFKIANDNTVTPVTFEYYEFTYKDFGTGTLKADVAMLDGEKLQLGVYLRSADYKREIKIYPTNGSVTWNELIDPVQIDVVQPIKLLNRILSSIATDEQPISGTIKTEGNERLANTMLVPAESIRGISGAKIYSSFNDFCEFMESVFGYVPSISYTGTQATNEKDFLINNNADFKGFTSQTSNCSTELEEDILFSTEGGYFLAMRPYVEGQFQDRSRAFVGYEQYQTYRKYGSYYACYDVRTDKVYRDVTTMKYYKATLEYPDGETGRSKATLSEYVLSCLYGPDYAASVGFGGAVDSAATVGDAYTGTPNEANIIFVRSIKKFLYYDGTSYYDGFSGDSSYNTDGYGRSDMVYVRHTDGKVFVIVANSLVMCSCGVPSFGVQDEFENTTALVTFKHRSELFRDSAAKTLACVRNFSYSLDTSRIYSSLKIGYEKQDYDLGNNGKDEFNFTANYFTGTTIKDGTLSLICPYRADCYGMQELAEKRGEDTSSTESDQQLFIVKVLSERQDDMHVIDRSMEIDGAYSDTVFNGTYCPAKMIEANGKYIGMFADKLTFASSDGNSDIIIDGKACNADIALDERLFKCGTLTISTRDMLLPSVLDGYVAFTFNGVEYKGYIKSVDMVYRNTESITYELIEK